MAERHRHNALKSLLAMLPIWIVAASIPLMLSECGNRDTTPIPRQKAYPRLALADSAYVGTDVLPIGLEINAVATLTKVGDESDNSRGTVWFDIAYPSYDATLHCTFTPVGQLTLEQVLANRSERIALNLGDATYENTQVANPAGVAGNIYVTRSNMVTPVMFLVTDRRDWVLSGAMTFNAGNVAVYDSVAPIVKAVRGDIEHMLKTICDND